MIRASFVFIATLFLCLPNYANAETYTPGEKVNKDFHGFAKKFIASHCLDCHGASDPEGNLSLHNLGPVDEVNTETWRSIWAQVTLKEMPPKEMTQPKVVERLQFSDWIIGELKRVMKDKGGFHDHLDPDKGNFVDHDLLFGSLPAGIKLKPTSTPARIWRVTPQEHITRLNELINREPDFDPDKPGLRTKGDVVPTNHGGELKLYFGTDRIINWQGGTVAYATAVKSLPAVLSTAKDHGLENYPDFYTVNSAESTQIMSAAEDIIRYMAYGPLSIAKPYQITDEPKSIADKMQGDLRGLPTSIIYNTKIARPLTPVYELMKEEAVTDERIRAAVDFLFEALTFRSPSKKESNDYLEIVNQSIKKLGKEDGTVLGLSSIFLDRDALFRPELVETGTPDAHGRVMLQDWELGLAVNHALRYIKPDKKLRKAIVEGRMRTKADVQREVERILADDSIRKPRIIQFFRDYFDYDLGGYICKDTKSLAQTGVSTRGVSHYRAMFDATASTDRLIELILEEDKDVLKQLLTTNKVVSDRADRVYFGRKSSEEERKASIAAEKIVLAKEKKKVNAEIKAWKKENPEKELPKSLRRKLRKKRSSINHNVVDADLPGKKIYARVSRRSFGNGTMKPERILSTVPEGQRLGILTHPSWLVSHSDAMDNHAIRRGKWIRERLLGGGIPDVPITVDAMLPDEPKKTLRERMRVTKETYCWTCHKKMDPLGLPFEMFNHAGVFRENELEKPVDTTGEIIDSGDSALDGKVNNAIELIQKLAESKRAEQVFVRHAFRFWMGRNETLNDAPVLQDAYIAYKSNGGSMKALLLSLLTSDAFLYRTNAEIETSIERNVNNWPDHRGPNRNYQLDSKTEYPMKWSVATGKNIRWRMPLPETGHSGIAAWNDRLFLTCFRNLTAKDNARKGTWVSETRGHCLDANTGKILWSCDLPGKRPNQVNGVFTDSTTPTPMTDGKHVWFVSAGGFMACYSVDGKRIWEKEFEVRTKHSAKQFQPFLHNGNLYYAMMRDANDPKRRKKTAADYDKNSKTGWPWMFVRSFDAFTGEPTGILPEGISVHSKGALGILNGDPVLLHAKGGSHHPPEKPAGVSLSRLNVSHDRIWERQDLYFEGTNFIDEKYAYCFDRKDFFVIDLATGETVKQIRVRGAGSLIAFDESIGRYSKPVDISNLKWRRFNTHRTNIGVGKYHFFMGGQPGTLGRIDIETEEVSFLQVPIQVVVENGTTKFSWRKFTSGDETGSRFTVEGDKRRLGHGFGHVSAATPIVVNNRIYFTTILGTVYVVDATAERFDENALLAVNDLGVPGETWTLSPFTASNGYLYQRTSKEIFCIKNDERFEK